MSNVPASYLVSAVPASATTSTWIFASVGLGLPHQSVIDANSSDWSAVCADILYAPVPTSVSGLLHQLSKLPLTTFWSTIMPATAGWAIADSNQPAAPVSRATTVNGSGEVRPVIVTEGSLLSSSAASAAPAAWFAATWS